jgi:hypothetical protein
LKITISLFIFLLAISGCGRKPAPPHDASHARPWGSLDLNISKNEKTFSLRNSLGSSLLKSYKNNHKKYNILAISGGGSHGAYGIGLINGWQDTHTMPKFDVVTGISTGSILSSFVFLGGEYTKYIAKLYTSINTSDIYHYNFFKIFGGSSITTTAPLKNMLKEEINKELLEKIAQEHKKGRRLYIGTTNIDNGSFTVWDMGAIAASDHKDKLQLYRDIIYASSAIPGIFDPQYFKIKYKNSTYYQLHIDGGMYAHVFMIGLLENWKDILNIKEDKKVFDVNLYVIGNRKYRFKDSTKALENDYSTTILTHVAMHSIDLLYDRSLYRLYKACKEKDFNFHYKGIDDDVEIHSYSHQFIPEEMNTLYTEAYNKALNGINWQKDIDENEILLH